MNPIMTWMLYSRALRTLAFSLCLSCDSDRCYGMYDNIKASVQMHNVFRLTLKRVSILVVMTCPHKPLRRDPTEITRLTTHFTCGLMSDVVMWKHGKKCCHSWHWISLLRPSFIKHKTHNSDPEQINTYTARPVCWREWISWQLL